MMASNIRIPTLRELVTLGSEAWEAVREAFLTAKSEIEALQEAGGGGVAILATSNLLPETSTDGTSFYVTSQKAIWTRFNGDWQRTSTDTSWASQTPWYISSTGTADATGADNTHPVSFAELMARLGSTPLATGITVYVLDDLNLAEATFLGENERDGTHWLYFEGAPTGASGTIATVQNRVASSNTDGLITGSSSLVSHVGKILRISGGVRAGARFSIAKNTSGSTVRISQVLDGSYSTSSVALEVGDPYDILTLPYFADKVTIQGGRDVEFALLRILPSNEPHGLNVNGGGYAAFDACVLGGLDVDSGASVDLYGCRIINGGRAYGKAVVNAYGCVGSMDPRVGGTFRLYDHVVQTDYLPVSTGGEILCDNASSYIAVYDCPGSDGAVQLHERALLICDGYLIGSGNTTTKARVQVCDGAQLLLGHAPAITGTGPELQVGGKLDGTGGRIRTFAQMPWTHPSGARAYVTGAATEPRPRTLRVAGYELPTTELLTSTATTTGIVTHTLTLGGTLPRTITINPVTSPGTYAGPWTISGMRNGAVQTETLAIVFDGSGSSESVKTYDPGTITVTRPAQNNTSGSYTITVGSGFGLELKAHEGSSDINYAGHVMSVCAGGPVESTISPNASITGPTASPPYGKFQFAPTILDSFVGDPFEVLYLAVE